MVSDDCDLGALTQTIEASLIASPAYQKWPTKNTHSISQFTEEN